MLSNRRPGGAVQHVPLRADGPDHCAGYADDGRHAHLQPGDLPGSFRHAGEKELSGCGDPGGHSGGGLLLPGAYGVVPAEHPRRGHRGHRRPAGISDLLRHREKIKNNIRTLAWVLIRQ